MSFSNFYLQYIKPLKFEQGLLPFSDYVSVISASVFYLIVILVLKEVMKNSDKKFNLTSFVVFHNFFLCGLSLAMLLGVAYELGLIISTLNKEDLVEVFFCDSRKILLEGRHVTWYYLFMLSKIYEFIDTIIILLKKRPLIFLHVYHHCITLLLTFVMLEQGVVVQWLAIIANATVHIFMYYYYAISCLGYSVWWKKYITSMQIVQFVVDLTANCIGFYYIFTSDGKYSCSGHPSAWIFGQSILLSFLLLFIQFYNSAYKLSDARHKLQKND